MEAEAVALDWVKAACHHWIYYCPEVELILDCQGLLGLLNKYTSDVDNRSLQQILIRAANYKWKILEILKLRNKI